MNKFEYLKNLKKCLQNTDFDFSNISESKPTQFKIKGFDIERCFVFDKNKYSSFFEQYKLLENKILTQDELVSFIIKHEKIPLWLNIKPDKEANIIFVEISNRINVNNLNSIEKENFPFRIKNKENSIKSKIECKTTSKFEAFKTVLIIGIVFFIGYLLSSLNDSYQKNINLIVLTLLFVALTIYFLAQKRYIEVTTDFENNYFEVSYYYLFSNKLKIKKINFHNYSLEKISSKAGFHYSLKINNQYGTKICIDSKDMGLNEELILEIEDKL